MVHNDQGAWQSTADTRSKQAKMREQSTTALQVAPSGPGAGKHAKEEHQAKEDATVVNQEETGVS
jgi:hypothetical protein